MLNLVTETFGGIFFPDLQDAFSSQVFYMDVVMSDYTMVQKKVSSQL